jgi:hypothetical protein
MRINGTYLDRLLWCVLPYMIIVGSTLYVFIGEKIDLLILLIPTTLLWLLDSSTIYFKKLKTLRINQTLFFDKKEITSDNIVQIKPEKIVQGRFTYNAIKFTVRENGKLEKYRVLAKPILIFSKKRSKTFDLLFEQFPELELKLSKAE